MSVELRRGRLYWYDRRRVGGKVRAEYHGPVPPECAVVLRGHAEDRKLRRLMARENTARAAHAADAVLGAGEAFDRLADRVFRAVMFLTGHRLHKRAEWRRKRGDEPMGSQATLFNDRKEPRPALIRPWVDDPAKQQILDRAAKGDFSVLPAVRELFRDERFVEAAGSAAGMAEAALIGQAGGDDVAVAEAMVRSLRQFLQKLLADAGPDPSCAERLAATRAAHAWLTVHILECMAAKHPAGGPTAAALDRRVSRADRRLHAALKSLAVLRRLRRPVVQVNVANGPMLVDNRGSRPAEGALPAH